MQNLDTDGISSKRRNPVIADVFNRLNYMERRGSGFGKIKEDYHKAVNFRPELEPKFYFDSSSFWVTLYNLNYGPVGKAPIDYGKVVVDGENVAIFVAIDRLTATKSMIEKAKAVYVHLGADRIFGRSDIAAITNDSVTSAGKLINKLKDAGLIEAVSGHSKGKYRFVQK